MTLQPGTVTGRMEELEEPAPQPQTLYPVCLAIGNPEPFDAEGLWSVLVDRAKHLPPHKLSDLRNTFVTSTMRLQYLSRKYNRQSCFVTKLIRVIKSQVNLLLERHYSFTKKRWPVCFRTICKEEVDVRQDLQEVLPLC